MVAFAVMGSFYCVWVALANSFCCMWVALAVLVASAVLVALAICG